MLLRSGLCWAQESIPEVLTESKPAAPSLITEPEFPSSPLVPAGGVEVVVNGTVQSDGVLRVATVKAPDGYEAFADAVARALPNWRFIPGIDQKACVAVEREVVESVWFAGTADQPKISVSRPAQVIQGPAQTSPPRVIRTLRRAKLDYPPRAAKGGIEGHVSVLLKLDPDGDVASASLWNSAPPEIFDRTALRAAERLALQIDGPRPSEAICAVWDVRFCMDDPKQVQFPSPSCVGARPQ